MDEKRRHIRLEMPLRVELESPGLRRKVRANDISVGGIRLSTERPIEKSGDTAVTIYLPDAWDPITAKARPVWTNEHHDERMHREGYEGGLIFTELNGFDRSRIAKFIAVEKDRLKGLSLDVAVTSATPESTGELIELVSRNLKSLKEDIYLLDTGVELSDGVLFDIMACDSTGQLIAIEVFLDEGSLDLARVIAHYDWLVKNFNLAKRLYDSLDRMQLPRFIILSPRFPEEFVTQISYLAFIELELFEYRCVYVNSKKTVFFDRCEYARKECNVNKGRVEEGEEPGIEITTEDIAIDTGDITDVTEQQKKIIRWLRKSR